jgi:hypothetical protein
MVRVSQLWHFSQHIFHYDHGDRDVWEYDICCIRCISFLADGWVAFCCCFCRVLFLFLGLQLVCNIFDQHLLYDRSLLFPLHSLRFCKLLQVRVCTSIWVFRALTHFYLCNCQFFYLYIGQDDRFCRRGCDVFQFYNILGISHSFRPSSGLSSHPSISPWGANIRRFHVVF